MTTGTVATICGEFKVNMPSVFMSVIIIKFHPNPLALDSPEGQMPSLNHKGLHQDHCEGRLCHDVGNEGIV